MKFSMEFNGEKKQHSNWTKNIKKVIISVVGLFWPTNKKQKILFFLSPVSFMDY
jgi:hypothetical protein